MDEDSLVVPVVSNTLEKYSSGEQGDLQGLDVYVYSQLMPSEESNGVGDKGREDPVEIEQEP